MSEWVGRPWGCCEHCREQLLAGWLTPARSAPVWLDFAFLARSARGASGGLDLEGAGVTALEAPSYPFRPVQVLAGQLAASTEIAAQSHLLELHLLDEEGTLRDWSADVVAPWPGEPSDLAGVVRQPLVLALAARIAVEHPGRHALVVLCNGAAIASVPFTVGTRRSLLALLVGDDRPRAGG